jgi:hypothetical protein
VITLRELKVYSRIPGSWVLVLLSALRKTRGFP